MTITAVDLFGGPGGWDLAARALEVDPLGVEWDDAACATRDAAGLRTRKADVAALDPADFEPCDLLIASPPCPTFSRAGKREGIADMPLVWQAAQAVAEGQPWGDLPWRDVRSELVVEPLRWALALEPRFIAWEQVPDVLPFWERCAEYLRDAAGYSTWTGVLEAERYGVPQTRERAILMAKAEGGGIHPPRPTHQRYVKGEAQRHDVTLEGEILPWVSMAEALGWEHGTRVNTRGERKTPGGNEFDADQPSWSLTEKARSWTRSWHLRNGNQPNAAVRDAGEPAPTVAFGHNAARIEWIFNRPAPTIVTTRRSDEGILVGRQLPDGEGRNVGGWGWERPATTVQGDPRVSQPGHHDGRPGSGYPRQQDDAIRVTLEEAAVLQSFPPDYPFQGTKSKRFEQVGNAVPPLLALAVLSRLLEGQT